MWASGHKVWDLQPGHCQVYSPDSNTSLHPRGGSRGHAHTNSSLNVQTHVKLNCSQIRWDMENTICKLSHPYWSGWQRLENMRNAYALHIYDLAWREIHLRGKLKKYNLNTREVCVWSSVSMICTSGVRVDVMLNGFWYRVYYVW